MPRRGSSSGGRDPVSSIASEAAPADFDESWLERIRERFDARYIDLTRLEDRRRWHPSKLGEFTQRPLPRGLRFRPRIVIVPEGHRLARFQTYGGRYSLRALRSGWKVRARYLARHWRELSPHEWPYGSVRGVTWGEEVSRRVGFAMPWQVVLCVRRKRRREVMHALGIAGRRGVGAGRRWHRNEWSDVRC